MSLKERFEQLEEREKKLLLLLSGIFSVMFVILGPLLMQMSIWEKEERNQAYREMIELIADERSVLERQRTETSRIDARYARKAPALATLLAELADQTGVNIPETQDRSVVPHGKTFKERQTRVRLNKIGLLALSTFLEKIAQSNYALSVSRLDIQKRSSKDDEYDAEIDVSAFDREEVKKAAANDQEGAAP